MLQIFLTIAINFANCKRGFSKLKLIKNYLRSTMSFWMRNLAILSVKRQLTDEIHFDNVIDNFANRKTRKAFRRNR